MSKDMLRRIPRLLDVPVGRKQFDPKVAELFRTGQPEFERMLALEVERQDKLKAGDTQQKGRLE